MFLLVLSVSALLFSGSVTVNQAEPCDVVVGSHTAVTPLPRPDRDWWMPRHQAVLDRIAQGNVDLLMIGDSIIHLWEDGGKTVWDKYYAPRNAVNLGFGGDRTEQVLWRLENGEIENIHPKLAVVMIGGNNANGDEHTPEQIAEGIEAIVCILRKKLPETRILILAIFPRGDEAQRADKEHGATYNDHWAKSGKASQLASTIADGEMIFFLDVNKAFLNEQGVLTREVMPDLVHPQEKGFTLWAEAMEPTIARLMGETR